MINSGNWVAIDKSIVRTLSNLKRPYSTAEALISHSVDVNCGKQWTVAGYAKMWQWSRGKVKRFVSELRTHSGHIADRKGTQSGHPIHLKTEALQGEADTKQTHTGHIPDTKQYTTRKKKIKEEDKDNNKSKEPSFSAADFIPDYFEKEEWSDLLESRKAKKLQNTKAALKPFIKQILLATEKGFTVQECLDEFIPSKWTRFKAEWMKKNDATDLKAYSVKDQKTLDSVNIANVLLEIKRKRENDNQEPGKRNSLQITS